MLSIGDFARYAGVSVRMLRHYDAIGLLAPSYVDPASGYRFYEPVQLDRAHTIVALRDLGFSLAQIGTLLQGSPTALALQAMLEQRRRELEEQIGHDLARLADVERRLRLMEGEGTMELEFIEKPLPALTLAQVTGHVKDVSDVGTRIGPMFEELVRRIEEAGEQPSHPGIAWYSGEGEGLSMGAGFERPGVPGTETGELGAVPRALTAVYRGSMAHIGEAWQELGNHVEHLGLTFSGPCREVYLHTDPDDPDAWITELQQPVA
ncbi:MerR family transcriptional regulator [Nocardioides cynanchi]|uniref:MerR family transcriptional regulator n=1 Tax=Nocardioides cynanchi TaxID=2558918 RepID=UPI001247422A|nr:MerR family transcriptional regulator [Nocardioides cynanchi]